MMVVIGLGSPFLTDDSVGPRVVRELAGEEHPGVRFVEAHAGGLLLLEELSGTRGAIIIDALLDENLPPGEVVVSGIQRASHNAACSHDCGLPEALDIGRAMGMPLPDDSDISLVAVVARDVTTFSEALTPEVEAAVQRACTAVRSILARKNAGSPAEAS
ncbi:hydrogenase maturation protease [Oryzomonas sagensis]|nr:hydrogenase maturation protease [Oryzomonas sagensis]